MSSFKLDQRMKLAIEIALTACDADPLARASQDAAARACGMSGAEVDAARRGWSFDVQTSLAIALAMACRRDDGRADEHGTRRERALRAGIAESACRQIETLAARDSRTSAQERSDA